MQITVTIPDDLAAPLLPPGQEPARAALEVIGLEAYRQRRISAYQLRMLLGITLARAEKKTPASEKRPIAKKKSRSA